MLDIINNISIETGREPIEIFILLLLILSILSNMLIKAYFPGFYPITTKLFNKFFHKLRRITSYKKSDYKSIEEKIDAAGYEYDINQDIFYSKLNAWQREMGYCRLYDEAAAPLSMIIDCEPIYFEYDKRRWMIEFWKGQYGMTSGCEVGVYVTDKPDIQTEFFEGPFFECVSDEDLLKMSYVLRKNGKVLFKRHDTHWWLTGFKLGEFSYPHELTVDFTIQLKDYEMMNKFIKGLLNAGYKEKEISIVGNSVSLYFDKPRTKQPYTRNNITDDIIQQTNKALIDEYLRITSGYDSLPEKLKAVQEANPEMINKIFSIGKPSSLYKINELK